MLEKNSNIVLVVAVGILIIIAVFVGWKMGQSSGKPGNPYLPPVSGTLDYYLSVNKDGDVIPYTPVGSPWVRCEPGQCGEKKFPISRGEIENGPYIGYMVIQEKSDRVQNEKEKKSVSVSVLSKAHAATSDGKCNIIGYRKIGGAWVAWYDPTDPDCPPH